MPGPERTKDLDVPTGPSTDGRSCCRRDLEPEFTLTRDDQTGDTLLLRDYQRKRRHMGATGDHRRRQSSPGIHSCRNFTRRLEKESSPYRRRLVTACAAAHQPNHRDGEAAGAAQSGLPASSVEKSPISSPRCLVIKPDLGDFHPFQQLGPASISRRSRHRLTKEELRVDLETLSSADNL